MTTTNQTRRSLIVGGSIAVAQLLTGCTAALWGKDQYQVEVSAVYLSEDGKKLVVMTEKYHYIFDAPKYFADSMQSPFHEYVHAKLGKFFVKPDNTISGDFLLWIEGNAPKQQQDKAIEIGYKPQPSDTGRYASGVLSGTRFAAPKVANPNASTKLNHTYNIAVEVGHSDAERTTDIALSPVRIVAGGVLIIGMIVLIPLGFIIQCMRGCK